MATFKFTGDPRMNGKDHAEFCHLFDMTFPAGEAVEVENETIATKLRRHNHFTEVRRGRPPNVKAD